MPLYAIRRIFDGKLLPQFPGKTRVGITWMEFEDITERSIPALWPTQAGATTAMKLWRRGGWRRTGAHQPGKYLSCDHKPHRDEFPVEIVCVQITPVIENQTEQQLEEQARSENSVLD